MHCLAVVPQSLLREPFRDNLPEELREIVALCEREGRSTAEAAAILEATPKAVESRLYRVRQILRDRLKGWS
jgi:RNA polymerase sigma-70 factor (ECF subfamily)